MTKLVTFEATVVHETEKAVKLQGPVGKPEWVPKSVAEVYDDGTVTLPESMAIEKGLI